MENVASTFTADLCRWPLTVAQALARGTGALARSGIASPRIDAELLLGMALGWEREKLYSNSERALAAEEHELFQALLDRRSHGEPSAYITGHREFWSLDFLVTPAVLVPRHETERLVEIALRQVEELARRRVALGPGDKFRILDLGTGSGAIAVSLAKERKDLEIWATDLSATALEIAQRNAERHGVGQKIHFAHGDAFDPVRDKPGFFHGIIANPPYVRIREIQGLSREVLREPRLALDGGSDGLDLYRRIIPHGHFYLRDQGFIALEMGSDMGKEVSLWFTGAGYYCEVSVHQDDTGRDRVVSARKSDPWGQPDRRE